ncbi:hypothetical protein [Methylopila turkensis]|uniref:Uncharacterized protein n=1 Tax=Methylopila turkensis TaxID=1437816 RepID=A0A9W6JME1_9HYPH|nr:hypothetical protein [Methylopila turkensis]GLK78485.1 hypothetical protein GCM10008174_02260 [Methylopila turkensis]
MCGLCGSFGSEAHWSDGVADPARTPTADRIRRAAVANETLALYGLSVREWGGRFTLSSRTGKVAVVDTLGAVWPAAEKLTRRDCDPLDEVVLARLKSQCLE